MSKLADKMPPELREKLREIADRAMTEEDSQTRARRATVKDVERAILAAYPLIAEHVAKRCAEICRGHEFTEKAATAIERGFKR